MNPNQIHPYSKFVLLTGFRLAVFLLIEGFILYLWCKSHDFFLVSSAQAIASTALRLLVLCFGGAILSEFLLRTRT